MSEVVVAEGKKELADILDSTRRARRVVALVPTMGALHRGHLALIEQARAASDVVVVSVFVNPTQFSDPSDFDRYPRDVERDIELAGIAGADILFAPSEHEMYPFGSPEVTVDPGPLGELLEGQFRAGHFRGVATVVEKLLAIVAPTAAYFGEKDYQQLLVIRRLVRDLSIPVAIVQCPTVRESDGLALSSRNSRLSTAERSAAPVLYRALGAGSAVLRGGGSPQVAEQEMATVVAGEPLAHLDYATVRDAATLLAPGEEPLRLLIAASFGSVRLIDNLGSEPSETLR